MFKWTYVEHFFSRTLNLSKEPKVNYPVVFFYNIRASFLIEWDDECVEEEIEIILSLLLCQTFSVKSYAHL